MKKLFIFVATCLFAFQSCEKGSIEETEYNNVFVENDIHCFFTAGLPSDQRGPETRVVLDGDYPSAPIVAKWQGSSSNYQDKFAILGYDSDGNIAHVTDATRIIDETEDSISGTFEFTFDKDYWIEDLEYSSFYPFYPIKNYDTRYYTGSDDDRDHWVYDFSEQTGHFDDLTKNLFMTGPELDIDNPSVEFQYGIAILRLSSLSIPGLEGKTVSQIKVRSNAIRDAVSYRYTFSDYYAAGNEISLNGAFLVNANGLIEENIYLVFYPSSELLQYLSISLESNGKVYYYSYSGALTTFTTGRVYSLAGAELTYRDTSPDFNWYLNPSGENHYSISNAKEFLGLQRIVNGDESALSIVGIEEADKFGSKTIDLNANATIDLSCVLNPGESWVPIDGFKGTLNGNDATISNLYIDGSFHFYGARIGLFASIESATIESLYVEGVLSINGLFNGSIGGLVGYANQSTIINCSSDVLISHTNGYGNYFGGIVGNAIGSSFVIGCKDMSTITVKTQSRDTDYAGGIVGGSTSYSTILACAHLNGSLSVNERSIVGGIIGTDWDATIVSACFNSGSISYNSYSSGQGGQIHGGSTSSISGSRISSCFFSGGAFGIGRNSSYGGPFNVGGTQSVQNEGEMSAACNDMNSMIEEWNSSNPSLKCSRKYYVENGQIVFN